MLPKISEQTHRRPLPRGFVPSKKQVRIKLFATRPKTSVFPKRNLFALGFCILVACTIRLSGALTKRRRLTNVSILTKCQYNQLLRAVQETIKIIPKIPDDRLTTLSSALAKTEMFGEWQETDSYSEQCGKEFEDETLPNLIGEVRERIKHELIYREAKKKHDYSAGKGNFEPNGTRPNCSCGHKFEWSWTYTSFWKIKSGYHKCKICWMLFCDKCAPVGGPGSILECNNCTLQTYNLEPSTKRIVECAHYVHDATNITWKTSVRACRGCAPDTAYHKDTAYSNREKGIAFGEKYWAGISNLSYSPNQDELNKALDPQHQNEYANLYGGSSYDYDKSGCPDMK